MSDDQRDYSAQPQMLSHQQRRMYSEKPSAVVTMDMFMNGVVPKFFNDPIEESLSAPGIRITPNGVEKLDPTRQSSYQEDVQNIIPAEALPCPDCGGSLKRLNRFNLRCNNCSAIFKDTQS